MKRPTRKGVWRIIQIFCSEAWAAALAHFFCFLIDKSQPNVPMVVGFLAGGSAYLAIWCCFGTSGSHINPSVTIAIALTRRCPPLLALVYLLAEFVGTLLAMGITFAITPYKEQQPGFYGMTLPGKDVTSFCATMTEALATFILLVVILASLDELRAKEWRPDGGAPFPLAVMIAIYIDVLLTVRHDSDRQSASLPILIA